MSITDKAPEASAKSGARVTVACKLPHGLELRLFRPVKLSEPVMGGGMREVTQHQFWAERGTVRILGNAVPHGEAPDHRIVRPKGDKLFTNGFALTQNVPKEFWDEWLAQNRETAMVKNGLIFAMEGEQRAVDAARERIKIKSGLEPLAQDKDPRVPRTVTKSLEQPPEDAA